eukprot:1159302-Pelagomonas_calceolata.AAC.8
MIQELDLHHFCTFQCSEAFESSCAGAVMRCRLKARKLCARAPVNDARARACLQGWLKGGVPCTESDSCATWYSLAASNLANRHVTLTSI